MIEISRRNEIMIFGLIVVFAIVIFFVITARSELSAFIDTLKAYGYIGAFALGFLSSFTIFIPSPAFIAVIGMASFLDPLFLGVATGIGSGFGEMTSYIIGRGAEVTIHRRKGHTHEQIENISRLFKRFQPDIVIFAFAAIPLLPVDAIGLFCGIIRYNWKKFLMTTIVGKILKFSALAFAGGALIGILNL
jgi:membrane protein YqaA with SNARE-associated domain